jgi:hypothetical protein
MRHRSQALRTRFLISAWLSCVEADSLENGERLLDTGDIGDMVGEVGHKRYTIVEARDAVFPKPSWSPCVRQLLAH